jgi:hypothetical protein
MDQNGKNSLRQNRQASVFKIRDRTMSINFNDLAIPESNSQAQDIISPRFSNPRASIFAARAHRDSFILQKGSQFEPAVIGQNNKRIRRDSVRNVNAIM